MSDVPRPPSVIALLKRIITVQNISVAGGLIALAGGYVTWVNSNATRDANLLVKLGHTAEFEADVDRRLNESRAWQRQTDLDRELVRRVLQDKIAELDARINQRKEARDEQYLQQNQRIADLQFRVCFLSKVPLSQCK